MRSILGLAVVGALLCLSPAHAADESGWIELFNGKDLTGWTVVGEPTDVWAVKDGLLHPTKAGGWLSTDKQFANYEFSMDFNVPEGSNSGLFLRTPREGNSAYVGLELQLIDDDTKVFGNLQPWQKTGSLYDVIPAAPGAFSKAGEWQNIHVRLDGPLLVVKVNGKITVETNLHDHPAKDAKHPGLKRTEGYIGLQNYGGRNLLFRNIKLRPLP